MAELFQTANVAASAKQDRIISLVFSVLCRMQRSVDSASMGVEVDIVRGGASKQPQVLAAKLFEINQVFLVPLVKTVAAISFKDGLPWELPVDVKEGLEPRVTAYIQGSSTLPKLQAASAVAESTGLSRRTDHAWKGSDFPWPFWLVRRSVTAEECNCAIVSCQTRHVSTFGVPADAGGSAGNCLVDIVEVSVPVLSNTKVLAVGDELVVHWKKAVKATQHAKTKTWQDAATQEFRQSQKAARV